MVYKNTKLCCLVVCGVEMTRSVTGSKSLFQCKDMLETEDMDYSILEVLLMKNVKTHLLGSQEYMSEWV